LSKGLVETMGTSRATPVLQKPAAWQIAFPTIVPLLVAVFATWGTVVIEDRYGLDTVPLVLAGWCLVLLVSAAWLNQGLFRRARTLLPFLTAIAVIIAVWLWQRRAFTLLAPKAGLTYGYFLKPEGAEARLWVLVCPFWVGLICLSVCCIVALVSWWRAGARLSLACMIPWWLAVLVVYAMPSMYLDGQGNASVFI
jgi:hypothetical protein